MSKLKLDLHDIFDQTDKIERALNDIISSAVEKKIPLVEIISGKGSGQLKKRVLRFLEQKHIRALYRRLEKDDKNFGRVFVHFVFFLFFFCVFVTPAFCRDLYEVSGIVYEKGKEASAIVNGEVVRVGDKVGDAEVVTIEEGSVTFKTKDGVVLKSLGESVKPLPLVKKPAKKEHPKSDVTLDLDKMKVNIDEVKAVTLGLGYYSGAITGYVIFRDIDAKSCVVDFIEPAFLDVYNAAGFCDHREVLGRIDKLDFRLIKLQNGDIVAGYPIKPFLYDLPKRAKAKVVFRWGRIEASGDVVHFE